MDACFEEKDACFEEMDGWFEEKVHLCEVIDAYFESVKAPLDEIVARKVKLWTCPEPPERKMPDEVLDRNDELRRWSPPSLKKHSEDALEEKKYPWKLDVYSFGMVCCEVLTGRIIFEPSHEEIVAQEVNSANVFRTSPQRAERKMLDEVLDRNDELLRRFAPSLKKHIEDALEPILGPVVSVLQSHGEAERKQRQTFFALEEKKLALRSEKIQLQRRRRGRICQHRRRAFSENSSRRRIRQGLRLLSLSE